MGCAVSTVLSLLVPYLILILLKIYHAHPFIHPHTTLKTQFLFPQPKIIFNLFSPFFTFSLLLPSILNIHYFSISGVVNFRLGKMATPNMATITASLERSLQNCSLNHHQNNSSSSSSSSSTSGGGGGAAHGSDSPSNPPVDAAAPTLELNSQASLPFHWEQCLDLKVK